MTDLVRRSSSWSRVRREIVACERCPRLIAHCRETARVRRRAYRDQEYWGRPVPGFGDPHARILLLGLAPAAHGANRTGRMFTGDRSGDWLYAALFRAGLANQTIADSRDDGMVLRGVYISAACRCAPPANRPTAEELAHCATHLDAELELLDRVRVVVALGRIAWDALWRRARRLERSTAPGPRPSFGHDVASRIILHPSRGTVRLLGSYHPSQQNTQTGRLTRTMFDRVIRRAGREADGPTER